MFTCLSKIWETSFSKACYSVVSIKKVNISLMFITKSFPKTSKPLPPIFSCEFSKFLQIAVLKDTVD